VLIGTCGMRDWTPMKTWMYCQTVYRTVDSCFVFRAVLVGAMQSFVCPVHLWMPNNVQCNALDVSGRLLE